MTLEISDPRIPANKFNVPWESLDFLNEWQSWRKFAWRCQMAIIRMKKDWWWKVFSKQDLGGCQSAHGFYLLTDSRWGSPLSGLSLPGELSLCSSLIRHDIPLFLMVALWTSHVLLDMLTGALLPFICREGTVECSQLPSMLLGLSANPLFCLDLWDLAVSFPLSIKWNHVKLCSARRAGLRPKVSFSHAT